MSTTVQFLGHATFKITTPEGRIVIVDPWLTDNPFIPEHCKTQDEIDLVLVTHGHDDHFDLELPAIIKKTNCKVVANNICRWYLLEQGVPKENIEPMNLGGTIQLLDMSISMVNAFHVSHINLADGSMTHPHQAVGFVVGFSDGLKIYFAGDTSVFGDMQLVGELYKPTIAVLPIGDRFTMGPLEAAYAIKLLRVKHVIPFHYGTYPFLTGTPEALAAHTNDIEGLHIHALKAGEILAQNFNAG